MEERSGGDTWDDGEAADVPRPAPRRRRGATLVLAGMLGVLQDMLEGRQRQKPEILRQADDSGTDDDDEPLLVELDPWDASQSVARVRPWLRRH